MLNLDSSEDEFKTKSNEIFEEAAEIVTGRYYTKIVLFPKIISG